MVVPHRLPRLEDLETDPLDHAVSTGIGEELLGDAPFAAVGVGHHLPDEGARMNQTDLVLLPTLLIAPGAGSVRDQKL
jgi:hypothetical protein